jgi:hypothetical protein
MTERVMHSKTMEAGTQKRERLRCSQINRDLQSELSARLAGEV